MLEDDIKRTLSSSELKELFALKGSVIFDGAFLPALG